MHRPSALIVVACFLLIALAAAEYATTAESGTSTNPDISAARETAVGVLTSIQTVLYDQLQNGQYQWSNALFAFIFGGIMLLDGALIFKWLVLVVIGIIVYEIAMAELAPFSSTLGHVSQMFIAIESALVLTFVAYKGYAGVQYAIGLGIGVMFCLLLKAFFTAHQFPANGITIMLMGNLCLAAGLIWFYEAFHKRLMAFICSIGGGLLVSSAVGYFVMGVAVLNAHGKYADKGFAIPDTTPPWIDFVRDLTVEGYQGSQAVGLFQNSTHNVTVSGHLMSVDFILGATLWFFLFVLGMWVQVRRTRRKPAAVAEKAGGKDANAGGFGWFKRKPAGARFMAEDDLEQTLLA